jgi:type II secretory pathway pseudopilin PulG
MVELLIVVGIIAILIALLIPAVTMVRNTAKATQQRAQLTSIEMALTAFKNDYGDYPPSHGDNSNPPSSYIYCGAQTLTEALVGWDLLGFHPKSAWRSDGRDTSGNLVYDSADTDNRKERKGPYLELATANVFRLGNSSASADDGIFDNVVGGFEKNTYVICDVFGVRRITIGSGSAFKTIKAGTPILYYRANTSSKIFDPNAATPTAQEANIYNGFDNFYLIRLLKPVTVDGSPSNKAHPLGGDFTNLYKPDSGYNDPTYGNIYGIRDSKITISWPHRPDSYILISAGADGLYGTIDDIRNF